MQRPNRSVVERMVNAGEMEMRNEECRRDEAAGR
jgi:hypothetical protein